MDILGGQDFGHGGPKKAICWAGNGPWLEGIGYFVGGNWVWVGRNGPYGLLGWLE
jgi:hypothetical protein